MDEIIIYIMTDKRAPKDGAKFQVFMGIRSMGIVSLSQIGPNISTLNAAQGVVAALSEAYGHDVNTRTWLTLRKEAPEFTL